MHEMKINGQEEEKRKEFSGKKLGFLSLEDRRYRTYP